MPTQKLNFIDNPLTLQEKFVDVDGDENEEDEDDGSKNKFWLSSRDLYDEPSVITNSSKQRVE